MTTDELRKVVDDFLSIVDSDGCDNEGLHIKEDRIYIEALSSIAGGHNEDAEEFAGIALECAKADYTRWYA